MAVMVTRVTNPALTIMPAHTHVEMLLDEFARHEENCKYYDALGDTDDKPKLFMKHNLNDKVRFKIVNQRTVDVIYAQYPALRPKPDHNGWCELQMWDFIQSFGRYMFNGSKSNAVLCDVQVQVQSD